MIRSLEINNVQSHEHSKLDFVDGVNVIIGSSNQGKSAILRALYWVRSNRPLGIDNLASHWIVNDKGHLLKSMSVKLVNDNGVVERRRTRDDNQYIVDGEVLNVVKTDVPPQVENLLNLSDTNVQRQLDSPFLLSKTNGEIAKYFNQMVNLDIIDKVLTNAESSRRRLNSTIDSVEVEIERLGDLLKGFDWTDNVESLLNEYEEIERQHADLVSRKASLEDSLSLYGEMDKEIAFLSKVLESARGEVGELELSIHDLHEVNLEISTLSSSLENVEGFSPRDFTSQRRLIERFNVVACDYNKCDITNLVGSIEEYEYYVSMIEEGSRKIDNYKSMLPRTCPLCGRPIEGDEHEICS